MVKERYRSSRYKPNLQFKILVLEAEWANITSSKYVSNNPSSGGSGMSLMNILYNIGPSWDPYSNETLTRCCLAKPNTKCCIFEETGTILHYRLSRANVRSLYKIPSCHTESKSLVKSKLAVIVPCSGVSC